MGSRRCGPGPARRLDQSGDGLRRFGGESAGEDFSGKQQDFGFWGDMEAVERCLGTLRDEDAVDVQAGAQGFAEQIGAFDADEFVTVATGTARARAAIPSSGCSAYSVQCEEASLDSTESPSRF